MVRRAPRHASPTHAAETRERHARRYCPTSRDSRRPRVDCVGCGHAARSSARRSHRLEAWLLAAAAILAARRRGSYIPLVATPRSHFFSTGNRPGAVLPARLTRLPADFHVSAVLTRTCGSVVRPARPDFFSRFEAPKSEILRKTRARGAAATRKHIETIGDTNRKRARRVEMEPTRK